MKQKNYVRRCGVSNCDGNDDCWIDIIDDTGKEKGRDRPYARIPFCKKCFDIIMPVVNKKEKEDCEEGHYWLFAPLSLVNEK